MTDAALPRRLTWSRNLEAAAVWLLLGLIFLILGFRLYLAFITNVDPDEFLLLSQVHGLAQGDRPDALGALHALLFVWLPQVADNQIDQIIAGRLVVYLLGLGSAVLLYAIGRHLLEPVGALFALFCYLTFSYVIEQGTSFRAEPICAFLFLLSIALLMPRPRPILAPPVAGLSLALAVAVTPKALLYLPVIAALYLVLPSDARGRRLPVLDGIALATSFALGLTGLLALSLSSTASPWTDDLGQIAGLLAAKAALPDSLFPQREFFFRSLFQDMIFWVLLGSGALLALSRVLRHRRQRRLQALVLCIFLLPLLYLPLFPSAFPAFYVFVLAPPVLLAGLAIDRMLEGDGERVAAMPFALLLTATLAIATGLANRATFLAQDGTVAQRETLALVERLFPQPVPYIDRAGMVAGFPRVGFFMDSPGLEAYRARNRPVFRDLIVERQPMFVIADGERLDLARSWEQLPSGHRHGLLRSDHELLRDNYLPHWGALHLPGKRLRVDRVGIEQPFEVLIPGFYVLDSPHPVKIDGVPRVPGSGIRLDSGQHRAAALASGPHEPLLRWASDRYRPATAPSRQPLFLGFEIAHAHRTWPPLACRLLRPLADLGAGYCGDFVDGEEGTPVPHPQ